MEVPKLYSFGVCECSKLENEIQKKNSKKLKSLISDSKLYLEEFLAP